MSGCEQIAQVAHIKIATLSKSLVFYEQIAHLVFRLQKRVIRSKQIGLKSYFLVHICTCFKKNKRFDHYLLLNERCEQIAQVAH